VTHALILELLAQAPLVVLGAMKHVQDFDAVLDLAVVDEPLPEPADMPGADAVELEGMECLRMADAR
jgi:hypothetical protein